MPRTKQGRKKSSVAKKQKHSRAFSSSESLAQMSDNDTAVASLVSNDYEFLEDFIEEFEKFYEKRKQDLKKGYEKACQLVKDDISELVEGSMEDQNTDPNKTTSPKVRQSRARKPVDPFDFKRPKTPKATRVASLTRSSSSSRKRSLSASDPSTHKESFKDSTEDQNMDPNKTTAPKPRAARKASKPASSTRISRSSSRKRSVSASAAHKEHFKTPIMDRRILSGATITPKIYSNTPISVMRRPLHGEMAVSMGGSPLMVGAVSNENVPTVNVPLHDGRVFSIMPEAGAPPLDLPEIDEETKKYLKTLRDHLLILAPNTP